MKGITKFTNHLAIIAAVLIGITTLPALAQSTDTVVRNTNDSGAGSLRQAITNANLTPFFPDQVVFNIPTSDPNFANGVFTIRPTSALPALNTPGTFINGASQTSFTGDTNPSGPEIVLNGSLAGAADGIEITSSGCTVNSLVLNGWGYTAVYLHGGGAANNRVIGSYIGTDASGNNAVQNGTVSAYGAVYIFNNSSNNQIGGTTPDTRNVISGNISDGIAVIGGNGNKVQGNYIGLNASGNLSLPNGEAGIYLTDNAQNNLIGGSTAGAGNFIATNASSGVYFYFNAGTGNAVIGNSMFGNRKLGIDLGVSGVPSGAVTPNDAGDADTGANNLQNFPVLSGAAINGNSLNIAGTLNSNPNAQYAIEFFADTSCNASGYGEGFIPLGRTPLPGAGGNVVATDANGNAAFNFSAPRPQNNSLFISATATRLNGSTLTDTSEFSRCLKITGKAGRDGDFDGDGKTDIAVYRPSNGFWYSLSSTNGQFNSARFGADEDIIAPADYDSNGRSDIGVFRPSTGSWYLGLDNGQFYGFQFGQNGDIPNAADLDGDGYPDAGVFRPSSGTWYSLQSRDGFRAVPFGQAGDIPVAADYDGDGRADIAVFRPSNGIWYVLQSRDGFKAQLWGQSGDIPVPADYDNDAKTNIAVFRPSSGIWYILNADNSLRAEPFGQSGDVPVRGDFDGDGRFDIGVFRPANGAWYLDRSGLRFSGTQFGQSGDVPATSRF